MLKGQKHSGESREKIRQARAAQKPFLVGRYGITEEVYKEAVSRGLRWCTFCKQFKSPEDFGRTKIQICNECNRIKSANTRAALSRGEKEQSNAALKLWRAANPGYEKTWRLFRKYGVTAEWYHQKLAEQGGKCAICDGPITGVRKFYCVDHDHGNGKIRGLLCIKCNTALERLDSFKNWTERALAYLAKYA